MKKFILSVFFLLGFIAMGTTVSAQSAGKVTLSGVSSAQSFTNPNSAILEIREILPVLYGQMEALSSDAFASKQKQIETTLYKTYSGQLQEGKSPSVAYESSVSAFESTYNTPSTFWVQQKLEIVQSFNNIVFN